ncbi:MAG: ABC transporter permease [Verrucomicrobiota bacterium]
MTLLKILITRRDLVANLVSRELKSKYKGSFLGILWSLINPLFMALVYVFFLSLLARGVPLSQILIGVFAWQFTTGSVQGGMAAITGNSNLVKKVFFPRVILPLSVTLANLVNYLLSLLIQFPLVAYFLYLGGEAGGFSKWLWLLPVMILYQTLFNAALAFLLSSANVFFRDTQHLIGVTMSAWFFLSPVMYNIELVQEFAKDSPWLLNGYLLNPLAVIMEGYRAIILSSVSFPLNTYSMIGLVWPLILLVVAYTLFQKSQKNFSDML